MEITQAGTSGAGEAAVEGRYDSRFEPLRDAFRLNFAERGELGAAVCVMVDNNVVADLYGGWADQQQGRRWQPGDPVVYLGALWVP